MEWYGSRTFEHNCSFNYVNWVQSHNLNIIIHSTTGAFTCIQFGFSSHYLLLFIDESLINPDVYCQINQLMTMIIAISNLELTSLIVYPYIIVPPVSLSVFGLTVTLKSTQVQPKNISVTVTHVTPVMQMHLCFIHWTAFTFSFMSTVYTQNKHFISRSLAPHINSSVKIDLCCRSWTMFLFNFQA